MKFTELGLTENLLEAISFMNFEEATEIQSKAIPIILEGRDVIGCAQTGTGKTAAFILPILNQIAQNKYNGTSTLVLCPTRELAIQIDQQIQGLAYFTNTSSYAVYGGGDGISWEQERRALSQGSDIIIATPGRLISHLHNGYVKFDQVKHLILDEADRMLDIGFYDDIIKIIEHLPKERQSLMFSATMAPKIRKLAQAILQNPAEVNVSVSKPAEGVTQQVYMAFEEQKTALCRDILADKEGFKSIIVFCSTKKKVEQLTRALWRAKLNVEGISSDYEQDERERVLLSFRSKNTRILVATDVMSRGIDIKDIDLVINYDVPNDAEDYVHRVGRTARAASKGMAITFVSPDEMYKFSRIEQLIERSFDKLQPPEKLGPGPEWKQPEKKGRRKKPAGKKQHAHASGKSRHQGSDGGSSHGKPKGKKPFYRKKRNKNGGEKQA
jgi:superfamily II DNA/RNA helicase